MKYWTPIAVMGLAGLLGASPGSATAGIDDLQEYHKSEPLKGAKTVEVRIELGLAEFSLNAGGADLLAAFDAKYDSRYAEPEFEVERDGEKAFVFIHTRDNKHFGKKHRDMEDAEYDVTLGTVPEISLKCELGLGENSLDLTNLKIRRFDLEAGLAETDVNVDTVNSIRAERVKIESGLGDLSTDHLGNLRFDRLDLEGGMGSSDIDLRGFEGEAEVSISVGMGSCTLTIPRSVGVRMLYDESFMSSVDTRGFTKIDNGRYESEDYDKKTSHIRLDLSVGMGSVDIVWRD